jgi:hypothetical protein
MCRCCSDRRVAASRARSSRMVIRVRKVARCNFARPTIVSVAKKSRAGELHESL